MKFEVHYKEKRYFNILCVISLFVYGLFSVALLLFIQSWPLLALYAVFFLKFKFIVSRLFIGYLKGNAIKVNEKQFPDVFEMFTNHAKKLKFTKVPDLYILQGNGVLNAFATKLAGRNFVVLYSDIFELAYQEGMDAVSFIIGHELGHIKRNHLSFWKSLFTWPAKLCVPFLGSAYSRACEYTCDNIGFNLCPSGASRGILVLAAGKQLYKKVNVPALITTSSLGSGWEVTFAEIFSTHPMLVKRITKINQLNRETEIENQFFVSPKIDNNQIEMQ